MNPILNVQDLRVSFSSGKEEIKVVRGVSFTLKEGESLGIIGESGSGKSAAFKALLKLLPQNTETSGMVFYKEKNLLNCSGTELQAIRSKEVAYISQDSMTGLNPAMKIGSQVMESYKKSFISASFLEARKAAEEILEEMEFADIDWLMEAYPHMISGGMRQRVLIALALIRSPHILIADEPTTALDEGLKRIVLERVKKMQKETRMSLVLISHDLAGILKFCDRIAVFYAGRIVESASSKKIMQQPLHPYTEGLLNCKPHLKLDRTKPLNVIDGKPPDLNLPLNHCAFCERCKVAMNICAVSIPSLYTTDSDHETACFKYDRRRTL